MAKDLEMGGANDSNSADKCRSNSMDVAVASSLKADTTDSALGGLGNNRVSEQLQSARNLAGGVQEQTLGGAVTEYRTSNAVGKLGVIETGLESTMRSHKARRYSDSSSSSLGVETTTGRSALTSGTLRPGRCIVRKCAVMVGPRGRRTEKVLLHPTRVDLPNGSLTAIIGPAGSGRTTLMKFLSGSLDNSVKFQGGGKFIRQL